MTLNEASLIKTHLAELAARLPPTASSRDMLAEALDHLLEAAAHYRAIGMSPRTAERSALRDFGSVDDLAPEFRAVVVLRDVRRQACWQLATVALLGVTGISVFRLIPIWRGELVSVLPPPLVADVAAIALLCPTVVLLALASTSRSRNEPDRTTTLAEARVVAGCLFLLGLPVCAAMVADQMAVLMAAPHAWLFVGAVGGYLVARWCVPNVLIGRSTEPAQQRDPDR